MKDFEVRVQKHPTAKIETWKIGAKNSGAAREQAENMLKVGGWKNGRVLSVQEA
jgi:hypothetical protein